MKILGLFILTASFAALVHSNIDCQTKICPINYEPVCGSNGKTYASFAALVHSNIDCQTKICPINYEPVCGSNGKTYGNMCELNIANCEDNSVELDHEGSCETKSPNCVTQIACISRYNPVCGTDGQTYRNGCYLAVARCENPELGMAHKGRC